VPLSTIAVTVKLFASVKDVAKLSETVVKLPDASVASDVFSFLIKQYPELEPFQSYIRIAVNEAYVDIDFQLHDGDEVAIIPPVSGGR